MKRTAFEVVADAIRYVVALTHPPSEETTVTIADIARAADRSEMRVRQVLDADYGPISVRLGSVVRWEPGADVLTVKQRRHEPRRENAGVR